MVERSSTPPARTKVMPEGPSMCKQTRDEAAATGFARSRRRELRRVASLVAALLLTLTTFVTSQSADYGGYRPHYQGYGVNTPGGRGGGVCRVTSLDDPAPIAMGTLRYCVEYLSGPRFVVFEISGTINLTQGPLFIRNPFITIAGQTAPSPGILIRGPGVIIDTTDVVMQHVRVRVGNLNNEPVAVWIRNDANNVVLDHASVSWSIWTAVLVGAGEAGHPPGEIAILDSIVAESLGCSFVNRAVPCDPADYPARGYSNSRAIGIGDAWHNSTPKVTMLRNISANNNDRHPEIGGSTQTILVNNLIYNPSQTPLSAIYYQDGHQAGPLLSVAKGNLLIPGPTTPGYGGYVPFEYKEEGPVSLVRLLPNLHPSSRIYLEDNYYEANCENNACLTSTEAQWMLAKDYMADWNGISVRASAPPLALANLPLTSALPVGLVEAYVKANAGARPLDRDVVDARIINDITTRTGFVPNNPSEVAGEGTTDDGFPMLNVNWRPLAVPPNPNAVIDGVGRTRIEAWLEMLARELEPAHLP